MMILSIPSLTLTLRRIRTGDDGTFGYLYMEGEKLCATCEDPWKDNKYKKSCIPKGRYLVTIRHSEKYGKHWHVQEVPNRDLILIHNGNTMDDTEGCILVGERFGYLKGKTCVTNSRKTLDRLRDALPDKFILIIEEDYI